MKVLEVTGDIFVPIFLWGGENCSRKILQTGCISQLAAAVTKQPRQSTCKETRLIWFIVSAVSVHSHLALLFRGLGQGRSCLSCDSCEANKGRDGAILNTSFKSVPLVT